MGLAAKIGGPRARRAAPAGRSHRAKVENFVVSALHANGRRLRRRDHALVLVCASRLDVLQLLPEHAAQGVRLPAHGAGRSPRNGSAVERSKARQHRRQSGRGGAESRRLRGRRISPRGTARPHAPPVRPLCARCATRGGWASCGNPLIHSPPTLSTPTPAAWRPSPVHAHTHTKHTQCPVVPVAAKLRLCLRLRRARCCCCCCCSPRATSQSAGARARGHALCTGLSAPFSAKPAAWFPKGTRGFLLSHPCPHPVSQSAASTGSRKDRWS